MTIQVKYFASLREQLGRSEDILEMDHQQLTVAQVWSRICPDRAWPPHLLAAVNQEYANPQQFVRDGDEVAFFPPITGG